MSKATNNLAIGQNVRVIEPDSPTECKMIGLPVPEAREGLSGSPSTAAAQESSAHAALNVPPGCVGHGLTTGTRGELNCGIRG